MTFRSRVYIRFQSTHSGTAWFSQVKLVAGVAPSPTASPSVPPPSPSPFPSPSPVAPATPGPNLVTATPLPYGLGFVLDPGMSKL